MPDFGVCYDSTGTKCSSGPQPGVVALRAGVRDLYPGIGDLGIFNCRPSSGGGGLSTHGEGRGWDAACNANASASLALGNRLAADLWAHHRELGIQRIIWNRRQIDVRNPVWRAYTGSSAHTDHLHIELCWAAAKGSPLTVSYVKGILGGQGGDDDMTPEQETRLKNAEASAGQALQKLNDLDNVIVDTNAKVDQVLALLSGGGGGSGSMTQAQVEAAVRKVLKAGTDGTP